MIYKMYLFTLAIIPSYSDFRNIVCNSGYLQGSALRHRYLVVMVRNRTIRAYVVGVVVFELKTPDCSFKDTLKCYDHMER